MDKSLDDSKTVTDKYILQVKNIVKEFSGVRVLDKVNFDLRKGEVHALLGENGAGKSTLIKIITGVYSKTYGEIIIDGKVAFIRDKTSANRQGIETIFQEFSQVPTLSVAENLFLGKRPRRNILGSVIKYVDWKYMKNIAEKTVKEFGVNIDVNLRIDQLGVAKKQIVEIIKALLFNARILIMDEPTASLSSGEIDHLFGIISELKKKGVSIIYISHRLEEVKKICDRATVLRDGKNVGTVLTRNSTTDDIVKLMIGKDIKNFYPKKETKIGEKVLEIKNLSSGKKFRNINFDLRKGEIIGIVGLVGSGKTEIARAIFGVDKNYTGEILFEGKLIKKRDPNFIKNIGIALVPEDRQCQGVITNLKALENIGLPNLRQFKNRFNLINIRRERNTILKFFNEVDIRPFEPEKLVRYFSGGNQQKIVVSKWLCAKAQLYMFDEPTRGIDVGAKFEIYKLITKLAEGGSAIIIFSSEVQEIIELSDKIIVMNRGNISVTLKRKDANLANIIRRQIGGVEEI